MPPDTDPAADPKVGGLLDLEEEESAYPCLERALCAMLEREKKKNLLDATCLIDLMVLSDYNILCEAL